MASLIGALRVTLGADTSRFEQGMRRSRREAATSAAAIQRSLGSIKAGLAGLAAGVTISSLGAVAKRALDFASSLGEVAQQLGVTTRQLQVFRYAASQVGVTQEEMDKGLGKLNITLGQAKEGAKAPAAAFAALSKLIGKDIVASSKQGGDALPLVADGLSKIGDRSRRAAIEVALFGRAGAKLDTLLSGGSKAIDELAAAAEKMGLILSDEQIQNADETADKLSALKQVLEARIAGAVADNAQGILQLANSIASLTGRIVQFLNSNPGKALGIIGALTGASIGGRIGGAPGAIIGGLAGGAIGFDAGNNGATESIKKDTARIKKMARDRMLQLGFTGKGGARDRAALNDPTVQQLIGGMRRNNAILRGMAGPEGSIAVPAMPDLGSGTGGDFLSGGGSRRRGGGKSAEQLAEEARRKREEQLRNEYEFASEQRRNQMDILQEQRDLSNDYSERTTISVAIRDLEREQERASLDLSVKLGDRTQAEADALNAQLDIIDGLERQKLVREEQYRRLDEYNQVEEAVMDLAEQKARSEADLARTAAERRQAELRLLDLVYRQERARLEAILADERSTDAEREIARLKMAQLGKMQAADTQVIMRGTMGPLESYLDRIPKSAAEMNEALQAVAANGLQALEDGLVNVLMGTESLAEGFRRMAASIIADLLRIQIQKLILSAVGGASGSSIKLPGFATGGSFLVGGRPGRDQNLMSINGLPVARVGRGERVSVIPPGAANDRSTLGGSPIHIHISGPMTDRQARQTGMQAASAARAELARSARKGG